MRLLVVGLLLCASLRAEPFECGKLTKASGTVIRGKGQIHTGSKSAIEITFPDGRIARVGSYAAFECVPGTSQMFLDRGTLLVSTPKGGKRATIQSGSVIVSGTDFQVSTTENSKVIGLNGKTAVALVSNPKEDIALRPGEVVEVPPAATKMSRSSAVNLKTLISTSLLLKMGPVPAQGAIESNAAKQQPGHSFRIGMLSPDGADPMLGLVAGAMQTSAILTQETARQQLIAQQQAQQAAAEAAAAQQVANARAFAVRQQQQQQQAAEQAAKVAAEQARVAQQQAVQQQAAQQARNQGNAFGPGSNQGKGPQGNQGQNPSAPPGQGNKPPGPPGQNK